MRLKVKVLFFGRYRELVGASQLEADVPAGTDVAGLLEQMRQRYPALPPFPVPAAVNAEFAQPQRALSEGDEVAFLPSFSGG